MKDTIFDFAAFDERVHENYLAFQGALQNSKDHQSESLLQTNFFQSVLKDTMECLLQSKESRRMPVKMIVSILENKGILSVQEAKNAMKLCEIRDTIAHCIDFKSIEEDLDKLIRTMDLGFVILESVKEIPPEDPYGIVQAVQTIARNSLKWNIYQRLDYVSYNLAMSIRDEVYDLREPNPLIATSDEPPLTEEELKESRDLEYHSNNNIP